MLLVALALAAATPAAVPADPGWGSDCIEPDDGVIICVP